ncbi:sulfite exporter TauE/SafE family protein [Scytonema sp. NUACC26]|uniref:sulfite exporter TauE/SafE family protein n=1 Tax=Scytonema sp. NUACC26 TaxID=3140176 RepID=UPI0034DC1F18
MFDVNNYFIIFVLTIIFFLLSYLGATVGLILGDIRLPLLIYALQSTTNTIGIATGTNLATSAMGAFASTYCHIKEGRVDFRLLCAIGIPSGLGAFIGMIVFAHVNTDWMKIVIGILLVYSGFQIVNAKKAIQGEYQRAYWKKLLFEILIGVALGVLSGAVGLMLGSIRLPAMIQVLGVEPKEAVGTNVALNFITASIGAITSVFTLKSYSLFHLPLIVSLMIATLVGSYLGAQSLKKINTSTLCKILAWVLSGTGTFMILENLHSFS